MSILQSITTMYSSAALLAQQTGGGAAEGAMAFGFICVFALLGLALFAFWVWSIIDAVKNPRLSDNARLIWIIVIVLTGGIGSLIYVIVGRKG